MKKIFLMISVCFLQQSCGYTELERARPDPATFTSPSIVYLYTDITNVDKVSEPSYSYPPGFVEIVTNVTMKITLVIDYGRSYKTLDSLYQIICILPGPSEKKFYFRTTAIEYRDDGFIESSFLVDLPPKNGDLKVYLAYQDDQADTDSTGPKQLKSNIVEKSLRLNGLQGSFRVQ